jgi:hypothetical protein
MIVLCTERIATKIHMAALLWALNAAWCFWIIKKVMLIYRTTGQTLAKAGTEAQGIVNQAAYDALTSDVGKAAVKSAATAAWEQQGQQA